MGAACLSRANSTSHLPIRYFTDPSRSSTNSYRFVKPYRPNKKGADLPKPPFSQDAPQPIRASRSRTPPQKVCPSRSTTPKARQSRKHLQAHQTRLDGVHYAHFFGIGAEIPPFLSEGNHFAGSPYGSSRTVCPAWQRRRNRDSPLCPPSRTSILSPIRRP